MGNKLRQFTTDDKCSQALTLDALAHAIRVEDIKAVLQAEGAQARRERMLNHAKNRARAALCLA